MNVNFRLERDRVEADFTVNKLVIEKERRRGREEGELFGKLERNFVPEKFKDRWIWIKLPYFKFSYSFVLSFRIHQFSHYLILEIRANNTIILFRGTLWLFLRIVAKLRNYVLCIIACLDDFYIDILISTARYDVFLSSSLRLRGNTWRGMRKRGEKAEERM